MESDIYRNRENKVLIEEKLLIFNPLSTSTRQMLANSLLVK